MARAEYIRSIFNYGAEILVDGRTGLPVGHSKNGVDQYFARFAVDGTSLVDGDGNVVSPAGSLTTITTSGSTTLTTVATQRVTLGGTHQLTMPASPGAVAESFLLILTCAGFTPTWSGVTWLTSSGVAPTLNTVAGKINVLTFVWDNSLPGWLGFMSGSQI